MTTTPPALWELPEVLLFHVISFIAGPTERSTVVCHQLAPLCKASRNTLLPKSDTSALWSAILKNDYGADLNERADKRSSKRLKQSHLQRVRDAHKMARDNAEIAYYYLSEMCNSKSNCLSKQKMCSLLHEYGAYPRINRLTSTGGTFLVELCRARHVKEITILRCIQELTERRGAQLNVRTGELQKWSLTALSVAAARGMPTVVRYLLASGADPLVTSTGRFRLFKKPRRTVKCNDSTPLEFAMTMRAAEVEEGATESDLADLNKVIRMLSREVNHD